MHTERIKLDNPEDAAEVLRDLAHSGLAFREFTALRHLDGRNLRAWQRRLEGSSVAPTRGGLRLVELAPVITPAAYRVRTEHVEIEVSDDFRDDTLLRLLRTVRAAGC
jgi:hypothetical protein